MATGIDTVATLTVQKARELKAAGYDFAGRYLVPSGDKALTKQEAKDITDAGMKLLTVWETTADRAKGGAAAGAEDGARALQCARNIGMPTRGIIYFAVDFGAQVRDMSFIEAYLRAARANTGQYEIGVYGPYSVIEAMAEREACKAFWQCVGWSGGKHSTHRNVYQADWNILVCDVTVDINECANLDAAGIWDYAPAKKDRYDSVEELPDWAQATVRKLVDRGAIKGINKAGALDLSKDMARMLVINDSAGAYDK